MEIGKRLVVEKLVVWKLEIASGFALAMTRTGLGFVILDLGFISDFGFRASDFSF